MSQKGKQKGSWPSNTEFVLEASTVEFLLAFALSAETEVETLLQFVENCEDTSESAQVMTIRHWQNWMCHTQFSDEETQLLEPNAHPDTIALNLCEAQSKLLGLEHIPAQSHMQPVDRAKEEEC